MKKILLGTSALCAVAAAAPAFAQSANEPVKLGIGGFFHAAYGDIVSQSGLNGRNKKRDDIQMDNIVRFDGSTKLDNGLTVGVSVQMRGLNQTPTAGSSPDLVTPTPDQVKRDYGFIRGSFGEFRIGDDDDARRQKAMTAPIAGGGALFGANTPDFWYANIPGGLTNTTMKTISTVKRVSRLLYYTPTIAGFSFAASYAPGGEKAGDNFNNPVLTATNGVNAINNEVSLAGSYTGKFGDFSLDAYVGGSSGHRVRAAPAGNQMTGRDNPSAIAGGAVVGVGPFKFGGAYEYLRDRDLALVGGGHQTRNTWDVGGEYIIGPFSVSLDWSRGIYSNLNGNSSAIMDWVSLTGDYVLGPGISLGAAVNYTDYKTSGASPAGTADTSTLNPYSGLALIAGLAIGF
jgi:predicted porin